MTSTSSSNGAYTAVATQTQPTTETYVDAFRSEVKAFTDQLGQVKLPTVDLTKPVARYIEYGQKPLNRA